MRIQHNIMAMNAYRNYNTNTKALSGNLEKLSSGYKINRAGDDAAGLAISEKMRAQITGLDAAQKNVKDGVSLVKTAEGAMQEIQDMLNRMDYLATQSANGTYDNEVDRKNLQKEVDALKSEINRIADSANFNGINLLDGKVGFNKDAFTVSDVPANDIQPGQSLIKDTNFPATTANGIHFTQEGSATQATVSFSINFDQMEIDASTAAGNTGTVDVTVKFGDTTVTVSLATTGGTGGVYSASDFASALATAFNTTTISGGTDKAGNIEGLGFKAEADGSKVTFTFSGTIANGATSCDSTGKYNETQAEKINGYLGMAVTVGMPSSGANMTNKNYLHGITFDQEAVVKKAPEAAGIDFKLTGDIVQDGQTLTIDGTTFVFQTKSDAETTASTANGTVIDVSKFGTEAEQIKEALKQMAGTTIQSAAGDGITSRFQLTADGVDTLHLDQTKESANEANPNTDAGKKHYFDTEESLMALFKADAADTAAVNAGTNIQIDTAKLASGNKISVGGKDYQFTDSATNEAKPTDDNATRMVGGGANGANAVDNLKAALEADGFDVTKESNGSLTVRSKAAGAAAPVVGGSGLTLQIGDTSDSFNQLSVKIGDMHTKAMGTEGGKSIADIDISSQGGAQEAVQTIKDAINYVSGIRGDLGAVQNRLEHTGNNLSVMAENIQDAESTIRDTDVASEMMSYVKNNILVQSAQAMLAQANQVPQGVLQLLG